MIWQSVRCLALLASAAMCGCQSSPKSPLNSNEQVFRDPSHGLQFRVPRGWTVSTSTFLMAHYTVVFLSIDSVQPDLSIREQSYAEPFGLERILDHMDTGEAYVTIGYFEFPEPTKPADIVGSDLHSLLADARFNKSSDSPVQYLNLTFFKFGHCWNIDAYLMSGETRDYQRKIMSLLQSIQFRLDETDSGAAARTD